MEQNKGTRGNFEIDARSKRCRIAEQNSWGPSFGQISPSTIPGRNAKISDGPKALAGTLAAPLDGAGERLIEGCFGFSVVLVRDLALLVLEFQLEEFLLESLQ